MTLLFFFSFYKVLYLINALHRRRCNLSAKSQGFFLRVMFRFPAHLAIFYFIIKHALLYYGYEISKTSK